MKKQAADGVAQAQEKVEAERTRLAGTIADIRRRADPREFVNDVRDNAVNTASHLADNASRLAQVGVENASRLASAGVDSVKRRPDVAGAAVGGVGLIAALVAWRKHSSRKRAERTAEKLTSRASVSEAYAPPSARGEAGETTPELYFDDTTQTSAGSIQPKQQETIYGQEQHQSR